MVDEHLHPDTSREQLHEFHRHHVKLETRADTRLRAHGQVRRRSSYVYLYPIKYED